MQNIELLRVLSKYSLQPSRAWAATYPGAEGQGPGAEARPQTSKWCVQIVEEDRSDWDLPASSADWLPVESGVELVAVAILSL